MVSHTRIYAYIKENKAIGGTLYKYLRHAKKKRKKYGTEELRGQIKGRRSIELLTKKVELVIGKLTQLLAIITRVLLLLLLKEKQKLLSLKK